MSIYTLSLVSKGYSLQFSDRGDHIFVTIPNNSYKVYKNDGYIPDELKFDLEALGWNIKGINALVQVFFPTDGILKRMTLNTKTGNFV